jgi:hypothetical protein
MSKIDRLRKISRRAKPFTKSKPKLGNTITTKPALPVGFEFPGEKSVPPSVEETVSYHQLVVDLVYYPKDKCYRGTIYDKRRWKEFPKALNYVECGTPEEAKEIIKQKALKAREKYDY